MSGGEIIRAHWMDKPETRAVTAALGQAGCALRFVGGCVRDTLLGRAFADIDIATDAAPNKVMDALRTAGLKAIPTGVGHGTVTAVAGSKYFQITTLRRDVETDGRHATVAFTDDWEKDAARRDLTINAIYLDTDGRVYDPYCGRADLAVGRVRFVGTAHNRIVEDVLRLLRYFRFYAHYGSPPPDTEALTACESLAPQLPSLSGERVRAELMKLLQAPDPRPSLRMMGEAGIFEHFLPEATNLHVLERLVEIEGQTGTDIDPIRRLTALLAGGPIVLSHVAERLRLSNAERDYFAIFAAESVSPEQDALARRHLLYRLGTTVYRGLVLLSWARADDDAGWRELLDLADSWSPKSLPLTGDDVLDRGIASGPAVGVILRSLELWWIEGNFAADRAECLERLSIEVTSDQA